jgi:hypothetical protein
MVIQIGVNYLALLFVMGMLIGAGLMYVTIMIGEIAAEAAVKREPHDEPK